MKKKKPPVLVEKADILGLLDMAKYADASVKSATIEHKLEYVPGHERVRFMEELHRILVPGGTATVVVCYWSSPRAIQDPMLAWPPMCDQSFLYFNKGWR